MHGETVKFMYEYAGRTELTQYRV